MGGCKIKLSALIADTDHAPDTLLQRQEIHKAYQAALAELTERGRSLMPHVFALIGWAVEHFDEIAKE